MTNRCCVATPPLKSWGALYVLKWPKIVFSGLRSGSPCTMIGVGPRCQTKPVRTALHIRTRHPAHEATE